MFDLGLVCSFGERLHSCVSYFQPVTLVECHIIQNKAFYGV